MYRAGITGRVKSSAEMKTNGRGLFSVLIPTGEDKNASHTRNATTEKQLK